MKKQFALLPNQLCKKTDPKSFNFKTTQELSKRIEFVGQSRAVEAVQFGIDMKKDGYHLYAMGPSGIGRRAVICTILEKEACHQKTPSDWCYIHHFNDPQKPVAIELPAGSAQKFCKDMAELVEDFCTSIPGVLESEEYHSRLQKISHSLNIRQEKLLADIKSQAEKEGLIIVSSSDEFTILPIDLKGKTITQTRFVKLDKKTRHKTERLIARYTEHLTTFLKQVPLLHKEQREKEKTLKKEFTLLATSHFIHHLKEKYKRFKSVTQYLDEVQNDVIENVQDFLKHDENSPLPINTTEQGLLSRYAVNVLVNHAKSKGAPVVYEENPSYSNLICKVEHIAQFGAFSTDFTLIKPTALHKANGGYLILDAVKLLQDPFAWEGLKRVLRAKKIMLEPPEPTTLSTVSLEPTPIPLNIKVILLGDRATQYLLCETDPDFEELFKVAVDFDENMPRTTKSIHTYAQFIATLIHKEKLNPFDPTAVSAIIDYAARLSEDQEKLSTHMRSIHDLIRETDYWTCKSKTKIAQAHHVKQAIDTKIRRLDRVRQSLYEDIFNGVTLIDVVNKKIGQINGLMILQLGSFSFGHPCRISAQVHAGNDEIIDVQREIDMSGPFHSKGILVLTGFLSGRYLQTSPLSLSASLVFEQTYSPVDGDSASTAELCALISAIADLPLKQSLAVTGSINQHGIIQAVGGINEKIEGFFDVCQHLGLTGEQGVIIPVANIRGLMLKETILQAVIQNKFHLYAVETIDDVMTLLTGLPAGNRDKNNRFPRGSVNAWVEQRLTLFSKGKEERKKSPRKKHILVSLQSERKP